MQTDDIIQARGRRWIVSEILDRDGYVWAYPARKDGRKFGRAIHRTLLRKSECETIVWTETDEQAYQAGG